MAKLQETKKDEFKNFNWQINFGYNVEKVLYARILATLLKSGINIADALTILAEQFTGRFQHTVKMIKNDVEGGQELSVAMAKHPRFFNKVYIGLVHVGEKTGKLIETLEKAAEQQEKDLELKRKVQSASIYPVIVLICLLGLAALLSYYILPQLLVIFSSFYMNMPWTTRALMAIAEFIRDYGTIMLVVIFAVIIFIYYLIRLEKVKPHWQGFLMSLPFAGELIKKISLARFARILGTLLESGISINEAILTTIESLDNEVYKNEIKKVKEKVVAGQSLGEAIEEINKLEIFPKLVSQMISVGERTGTLEGNLIYLAEFYEKEVDNASKNISSVIEPVLLIIVGFVVVFVAVAIISPIYEFIATLSASI